jgi:carbon storage regulator
MLVLSRKLNEEIVINSEIKIKIISISENQVKIGVVAPDSVKILRGEIYEKVKEYTIEASVSSKQKVSPDISKLKVNKI